MRDLQQWMRIDSPRKATPGGPLHAIGLRYSTLDLRDPRQQYGNQVLQRLMDASLIRPKLRIGQPNGGYERVLSAAVHDLPVESGSSMPNARQVGKNVEVYMYHDPRSLGP